MGGFLLRRLMLAVLVCVTVLIVSFALTRLSGDVAVSMAGPNASLQDVETIRHDLRPGPAAAGAVPQLAAAMPCKAISADRSCITRRSPA